MLRQTQSSRWRVAALAAFGIGVVGIVIPVLPTVPFLILSAWAASKGWPAFERRLPFDTSVDIAYVGAKGVGGYAGLDVNAPQTLGGGDNSRP